MAGSIEKISAIAADHDYIEVSGIEITISPMSQHEGLIVQLIHQCGRLYETAIVVYYSGRVLACGKRSDRTGTLSAGTGLSN
jgi:hypothetical protein